MVGGLRFSRSAGARSLSPFGVASPRGASADELPAELQRRKKRLAAIEEVKARLEPTRRAGASPSRTVHPSGAAQVRFLAEPQCEFVSLRNVFSQWSQGGLLGVASRAGIRTV